MRHSRFQSKLKKQLPASQPIGLIGASSASASAPASMFTGSLKQQLLQQQPQLQREPLVPMPPCEMKWVGLTIAPDSSEAAVIGHMELFALDRLHFVESGGPDRNVLSKHVHQFMQCSGHAGTLPLAEINHDLQRFSLDVDHARDGHVDDERPDDTNALLRRVCNGTIRQEDGIKKLTAAQAKEFFLLQMNNARGGSRGNTTGLQTLLDYVSTGTMSTEGEPDECPMCMNAPLHALRPVFR